MSFVSQKRVQFNTVKPGDAKPIYNEIFLHLLPRKIL